MRLCKIIAIQWRNCINNCFNLFFQSVSKKYRNIVFLLIFRTSYVRWIFLNPSYTAPSGLILPGLAPGPPYKLGRSLSARLAGGESPPDSPKQARESRFPSLIRGANLTFSPRYSPFHLCHRNFNITHLAATFPTTH